MPSWIGAYYMESPHRERGLTEGQHTSALAGCPLLRRACQPGRLSAGDPQHGQPILQRPCGKEITAHSRAAGHCDHPPALLPHLVSPYSL